MNLFRGQLKADEVFPFPNGIMNLLYHISTIILVMTDDQEETLKMLLDPTAKFFEEQNDALKNDALEKVEDSSMQGLRELGAFGLQVPTDLGC